MVDFWLVLGFNDMYDLSFIIRVRLHASLKGVRQSDGSVSNIAVANPVSGAVRVWDGIAILNTVEFHLRTQLFLTAR